MLDVFKKEIKGLTDNIIAIEGTLTSVAQSLEKSKNEVDKLKEGINKYEKENPELARQMKALIEAKFSEFVAAKQKIEAVKRKQASYNLQIKKLYLKINNWKKLNRDNKQASAAAVVKEKKVSKTASVPKKEEKKAVPKAQAIVSENTNPKKREKTEENFELKIAKPQVDVKQEDEAKAVDKDQVSRSAYFTSFE